MAKSGRANNIYQCSDAILPWLLFGREKEELWRSEVAYEGGVCRCPARAALRSAQHLEQETS